MTRTTRRLPTGNDRIALRRRAADLYCDGRTIRSVARQIDRSYGTARTLLLEAGVRLRKPGGLRSTSFR